MRRAAIITMTILAMTGMTSAAQAEINGATIQLQYREPILDNGDLSQTRQKILQNAEKDCEAAAKPLGRHCVINNMNFGNNNSGCCQNQGGLFLSGNVNATLTADPIKAQ